MALSATASTIAIALILGSSVLSPGTFRREPSADLAQEQQSSDPGDRVLGTRVSDEEEEEGSSSLADDASSEELVDGDDPTSGLPGDHSTVQNDSQIGTIEGPSVSIEDGTSGSGGEPDGGSGPTPGPQPEPTQEPEPEPEPAPEPEPTPEPTSPPKGNGNGNGQDKGNSANAPGHNKDEEKGKP